MSQMDAPIRWYEKLPGNLKRRLSAAGLWPPIGADWEEVERLESYENRAIESSRQGTERLRHLTNVMLDRADEPVPPLDLSPEFVKAFYENEE